MARTADEQATHEEQDGLYCFTIPVVGISLVPKAVLFDTRIELAFNLFCASVEFVALYSYPKELWVCI